MSAAERDQQSGDRQFVAALERGLRVLRAFASSREVLSNTELAKRTELTKPTVSRLTYTLARLGYLNHDRGTGLYRLGSGALALGYAAFSNIDVREIARPIMQELADYAPGGVLLCARTGLDMVCLELRRKPQVIGHLEIGDRMPLALTAAGRALLAVLSKDARDQLLEEVRTSQPDRWPVVQRGIAQALKDMHERGFCMTIGDWFPEINAAAVPLQTATSYGTLVLHMGGFASVLPTAMLEEDIGPRLVRSAQRIDELVATSRSRS